MHSNIPAYVVSQNQGWRVDEMDAEKFWKFYILIYICITKSLLLRVDSTMNIKSSHKNTK